MPAKTLLMCRQTPEGHMTQRITAVILLLLLSSMVHSGSADCKTPISTAERQDALLKTNLYGIGFVTAWGMAEWDYFTRSPHTQSEGWFDNETGHGGADKLGHFYASYVLSHGLSYLYESRCFSHSDAATYGALSSFAILGYMELGDAYSDHGFSREDLITNALGSLLAYSVYKNPELANRIDIRWEYGLHPEGVDFFTDYDNHKYLLAIKLNGFGATRHSFLKHIELHLGYYTRGFSDYTAAKERHTYIGIGLNLTDLFRRYEYRKTAAVLNYIQIPGTYIEFDRDINK